MSRRIILLAALSVVLSGCGSSDATSPFGGGLLAVQTRLAEDKWMRGRPLTYRMVEVRTCFCLPAATAPMWVEVARLSPIPEDLREGVVSVTYQESGEPVPTQYAQNALSVQGLFEKIRAARAAGAARVEAEFDPTWGFPRRVYIDYHAAMADDEVMYEIREFRPVARTLWGQTP